MPSAVKRTHVYICVYAFESKTTLTEIRSPQGHNIDNTLGDNGQWKEHHTAP